MNLIAAIKTGRRIRSTVITTHHYDKWFTPNSCNNYTTAAILSEGWEVEDEKILLSASDIEKAWCRVFDKSKFTTDNLCKELGFK